MNSAKRNKIATIPALAIVLLSVVLLGFGPNPAAPPRQEAQSMPAGPVILRLDNRLNPFHVPRPEGAELGIQSASFTINWNPASCSPPIAGATLVAWPSNAQTAFSYAATIWGSLLNSGPPIEVDACWWSTLGTGVLGSAGTTSLYRDFTNAPVAGTWYPVALANALSNSDLNGGTAEISANFSSAFSWYYGTDGNPGAKLDFASVVLHELGHGLGFLGSMTVLGGNGYWGFWTGFPATYDRFTENGATPLLNYASGSSALASALTSNNVYFNGPNANAANGGGRVKLYAPALWDSGSSYAHLDEIFNNTPNALMTYSLAFGESEHHPGPVTLGMFQDMGWSVNDTSPGVSKQLVSTNLITTSARITYNITVANAGTTDMPNTTVSDSLPTRTSFIAGSAASNPVINLTNFPTQTLPFTVGAGSSVVITYAVQVGVVTRGDLLTNTVTVSSPALSQELQATTLNIADPLQQYLPLIVKGN